MKPGTRALLSSLEHDPPTVPVYLPIELSKRRRRLFLVLLAVTAVLVVHSFSS